MYWGGVETNSTVGGTLVSETAVERRYGAPKFSPLFGGIALSSAQTDTVFRPGSSGRVKFHSPAAGAPRMGSSDPFLAYTALMPVGLGLDARTLKESGLSGTTDGIMSTISTVGGSLVYCCPGVRKIRGFELLLIVSRSLSLAKTRSDGRSNTDTRSAPPMVPSSSSTCAGMQPLQTRLRWSGAEIRRGSAESRPDLFA